MVYLEKFRFPSREKEEDYVSGLNESYYNKTWEAMYPFYVLSEHNFMSLDFEPITIIYGGNGSGKSTALNYFTSLIPQHHFLLNPQILSPIWMKKKSFL